jgi:hypothetical protein
MLTAEDQAAIEGQLAEFLKKSEAHWSALVDKGGNLFAQSGDTGTLDLSILSALAAGSFAATHELARRLGESEFSAFSTERMRTKREWAPCCSRATSSPIGRLSLRLGVFWLTSRQILQGGSDLV